jgi:hypothetical protein
MHFPHKGDKFHSHTCIKENLTSYGPSKYVYCFDMHDHYFIMFDNQTFQNLIFDVLSKLSNNEFQQVYLLVTRHI